MQMIRGRYFLTLAGRGYFMGINVMFLGVGVCEVRCSSVAIVYVLTSISLPVADVLSFASPKESTKEKATSNGIAPRVRSSSTLLSFGSITLHGAVFRAMGCYY
jgi:organic radical activating enzyme